MMDNYILDGQQPVPCADLDRWSKFMASKDERRVALTKIGETVVSTVFLGVDHNWSGVGAPVLFETMVFGGPFANEQQRYSTWNKAVAGHDAMVERVRTAPAPESAP